MAELPEKSDYVASVENEMSGEELDMYHAVIKDAKEDMQTKGNDVGDMYRMGKQQQFKVRLMGPPLHQLLNFPVSVSFGRPLCSCSRP